MKLSLLLSPSNKIDLTFARRLALALTVVLLSTSAWSFQYGGGKCSFKINFPEKPSLSQISWQAGLSYEQAQYIGDTYFLRAECLPVGSSSLTVIQLMAIARKFSENEGLMGTVFSSSQTVLGNSVIAKGAKSAAGVASTYEYRCTLGTSSTLCLTVGAPTLFFPTPAIDRFFRSVAAITAEETRSDAWTSIGNGMFLNFSSIQYAKTMKAWVLRDDGLISNGALSQKIQYEIDCNRKLFRMNALIGFEKPAAEGRTVFSISPSAKWTPVPPESVIDQITFRVCLVNDIYLQRASDKKVKGTVEILENGK